MFQKLLPIGYRIITSSHSAFVTGRSIQDNTIVAYEILHYTRVKKRGRDGYVALKIDISKAYDRLEWYFIWDMMLTLGFASEFVDSIMWCVSLVLY